MAEKTIKTRIINKHAVKADWDKATNFIPKKGEIIIYDDLKKIKIGDGETTVVNLDFMDGGTEIDTGDFVSKSITEKQSINSPLSIVSDNSAYFELYSNTGNIVQFSDTGININYGDDVLNYPSGGEGEQTIATQEWVYGHNYLIADDLVTKQDVLVSGTNIKTINGESVLGSGDIVIEAEAVDTSNLAKTNSNNTLDGVQFVTGYYTSEDSIPSYATRISRSGVDVFGDMNYSPYVNESSLSPGEVTFTEGDYMSETLMTTSYKVGQIINKENDNTYTLTLPEKSGTLATTDDIPEAIDTSDFIDKTSAQTITGAKYFENGYNLGIGVNTPSYTYDVKIECWDNITGEGGSVPGIFVENKDMGFYHHYALPTVDDTNNTQETLATQEWVTANASSGSIDTSNFVTKNDTILTLKDSDTYENGWLSLNAENGQITYNPYPDAFYSPNIILDLSTADPLDQEKNATVKFNLPTKPDGTYTLATTDDISGVDTSGLIQVGSAPTTSGTVPTQTIHSNLEIGSSNAYVTYNLKVHGYYGGFINLVPEQPAIQVRTPMASSSRTFYFPESGGTLVTTNDLPDTSDFVSKSSTDEQTLVSNLYIGEIVDSSTSYSKMTKNGYRTGSMSDYVVYSLDGINRQVLNEDEGGSSGDQFLFPSTSLDGSEYIFVARKKITLAELQANLETYCTNRNLIQIVPLGTSAATDPLYAYRFYGGECLFTPHKKASGAAVIQQVFKTNTLSESIISFLGYSLNITNSAATLVYAVHNFDLSSLAIGEGRGSTTQITDSNCEFYVYVN